MVTPWMDSAQIKTWRRKKCSLRDAQSIWAEQSCPFSVCGLQAAHSLSLSLHLTRDEIIRKSSVSSEISQNEDLDLPPFWGRPFFSSQGQLHTYRRVPIICRAIGEMTFSERSSARASRSITRLASRSSLIMKSSDSLGSLYSIFRSR